MTQERIIRAATRVPGGYTVQVEVTNAYTDGTSRFEEVWVSRDAIVGKTPDERRQALFDALVDDPIAEIAGETVAEPTATKDILEARMVARFADWQRWKATREEAEARGLAANVITALTARVNAAWTAYVALIQAWRVAP